MCGKERTNDVNDSGQRNGYVIHQQHTHLNKNYINKQYYIENMKYWQIGGGYFWEIREPSINDATKNATKSDNREKESCCLL